MKFLVDAQLPARLAPHSPRPVTTRSIPANCPTAIGAPTPASPRSPTRTAGSWSPRTATSATVTWSTGRPRRLLVIATGNITNAALLALVETHLEVLAATFDDADFIELTPNALVVHERPTGR